MKGKNIEPSVPFVNLNEQHRLIKEALLATIENVFEHSQYILGQEVETFEEKIAKYCGVKYAVGVNSGTDALFLAMKALGIKEGDEVITVPNSFLATTSSIIAANAKPVFVDVSRI